MLSESLMQRRLNAWKHIYSHVADLFVSGIESPFEGRHTVGQGWQTPLSPYLQQILASLYSNLQVLNMQYSGKRLVISWDSIHVQLAHKFHSQPYTASIQLPDQRSAINTVANLSGSMLRPAKSRYCRLKPHFHSQKSEGVLSLPEAVHEKGQHLHKVQLGDVCLHVPNLTCITCMIVAKGLVAHAT